MKEILNSILLIEKGEDIFNVHTGTNYKVSNIEESNILLKSEEGSKIVVGWNELMENFELKNKI